MCLVQIQESPLQMLKTLAFIQQYIGMYLDTSIRNGMKRRLPDAFGGETMGRGYITREDHLGLAAPAGRVQAVSGDCVSAPWKAAGDVGESKVGRDGVPWIMGSSRIAQLTRHLPPANGL